MLALPIAPQDGGRGFISGMNLIRTSKESASQEIVRDSWGTLRNMDKLSNYQWLASQDKCKKLKRSAILRLFIMTFPKPFMKFPNKCYAIIIHALFNIFIIYSSMPKKGWFNLVCGGYCLTAIKFLLLPCYLDF